MGAARTLSLISPAHYDSRSAVLAIRKCCFPCSSPTPQWKSALRPNPLLALDTVGGGLLKKPTPPHPVTPRKAALQCWNAPVRLALLLQACLVCQIERHQCYKVCLPSSHYCLHPSTNTGIHQPAPFHSTPSSPLTTSSPPTSIYHRLNRTHLITLHYLKASHQHSIVHHGLLLRLQESSRCLLHSILFLPILRFLCRNRIIHEAHSRLRHEAWLATACHHSRRRDQRSHFAG